MFIGSYYVYPCLILLQVKLDTEWNPCPPPPELESECREECHPSAKSKLQNQVENDDDPRLRIRFASPQSIHNCLNLPSAATIGPAIGLPSLTPGE